MVRKLTRATLVAVSEIIVTVFIACYLNRHAKEIVLFWHWLILVVCLWCIFRTTDALLRRVRR